ncbi:MAG: hypothetical protein ACLP1X_33065 [Polyangiaceae bacterium]
MRRLLCCACLPWAAGACSSTLNLGSNDAGVPYDADCKAGTYSGTYACSSSADADALPLPASTLPASGPLSMTLVTVGAPTTLAISPDASVSSTISGGTASSELTGTLDCSTRKLTGAISGFAYSSAMFSLKAAGTGVLSADYDADASPPALVNGVMDPPGLEGSSTCTWTANLR